MKEYPAWWSSVLWFRSKKFADDSRTMAMFNDTTDTVSKSDWHVFTGLQILDEEYAPNEEVVWWEQRLNCRYSSESMVK
jgi:hypothetical protein